MHTRVGAVDDVNQPTIINLDIVGLNDEIADLHGRLARGNRDIRAADISVRRCGGNVVRYFFWDKWIPHVDRPNPCVEPRDKGQFSVVNVGEVFAAGVGAEATAAVAEVTALLVDLVIGNDRRKGLVSGRPGCDVDKVNELAVPGTYARAAATTGLVDQDHKVPRRILRLRGQRWYRLSKQREGGMCAHGTRGVQAA